MTFVEAVGRTADIAQCLEDGLQAMGTDSNKISVPKKLRRKIDGSVDIDTCVKHKYPNENRWDYVIGYCDRVYYVEVHPANTKEVKVVIAKLNWLKHWRQRSSALESLRHKSSHHWIASNGIHITKSSKYSRQLTTAGIGWPRGMLNL